jgi:hypothetical protein
MEKITPEIYFKQHRCMGEHVNNELYSAMKLSFVVVDGKQPLKYHFPDTGLEVSHLLEIWTYAH